MWAETKQRLVEIVKTLTAPANTFYQVMEYTPVFRDDTQWYMVTVQPKRDSVQPATTSEFRIHNLSFVIEVTSPQINTQNEMEHEYYIEQYADAITALLDRYPRLEDTATRIGLSGVSQTFMTGAVFQSPRAYPTGGAINHYSASVPLQITYRRATGC